MTKTIGMFVGELEFSDIPLDSHFRRVFFLSLVFHIVVVLMNLLNGLAVSILDSSSIEIQPPLSRLAILD